MWLPISDVIYEEEFELAPVGKPYEHIITIPLDDLNAYLFDLEVVFAGKTDYGLNHQYLCIGGARQSIVAGNWGLPNYSVLLPKDLREIHSPAGPMTLYGQLMKLGLPVRFVYLTPDASMGPPGLLIDVSMEFGELKLTFENNLSSNTFTAGDANGPLLGPGHAVALNFNVRLGAIRVEPAYHQLPGL